MTICGQRTGKGEACKVSITKGPCRFHGGKAHSPKQTPKKTYALKAWAREHYGDENDPTVFVVTSYDRVMEIMKKMIKEGYKLEDCEPSPEDIKDDEKFLMESMKGKKTGSFSPEFTGLYNYEIEEVTITKRIPKSPKRGVIYIEK